jgi:hypothetical protein
MIIHTVLLNLKPETTEDEIKVALDRIRDLQQVIPGILSVQIGQNLNHSNNQGYTYGFVMHFLDREQLKIYASHPTHILAGKELVRISQSIIDFDIEAEHP